MRTRSRSRTNAEEMPHEDGKETEKPSDDSDDAEAEKVEPGILGISTAALDDMAAPRTLETQAAPKSEQTKKQGALSKLSAAKPKQAQTKIKKGIRKLTRADVGKTKKRPHPRPPKIRVEYSAQEELALRKGFVKYGQTAQPWKNIKGARHTFSLLRVAAASLCLQYRFTFPPCCFLAYLQIALNVY